MAKNRFSKFIQPKEPTLKSDNKDVKHKAAKLSDTQSYLISTHTAQESPLDILIGEELIDKLPRYLEVTVSDQATTKFVVIVTEESVLQYREKNIQQISVLRSITNLLKVDYDINYRFQANFRIINDQRQYRLKQIEILVKDHFFSRRDQMQINRRLLDQTCYTNKQVMFGAAKILITNLLCAGTDIKNQELSHTGIITNDTIILYRGLEAKLALLIEISEETFKLDAVGEISLESMTKFLKIFQIRNSYFQTNHKLEIILYSRIYYPEYNSIDEFQQNNKNPIFELQYDEFGRVCMDVYKKIPQRKPIRQFDSITNVISQDIKEFLYWMNCKYVSKYHQFLIEDFKNENKTKLNVVGTLCESKNCNLLETIGLVTQQFRQDYSNRSLTNSGHGILILSAGNGYFFGDLHNYKITKRNVMRNNITCYLCSFGRIPQISSPMYLLFDSEKQLFDKYYDRLTSASVIKSQQLKHLYWIEIIKYNDEFLRSYFLLYDKPQNTNEYFYLCLKNSSKISYSQLNFTLQTYATPKEIKFATDQFDQQVQSLLDPIQEVNLNTYLMKSQMADDQIEKMVQINAQRQYQSNTKMPNIFYQREYTKNQESQDSSGVQHQPKQEKQEKKTEKEKVFTHNRMKWNLFYWDSKAHGFLFQMNQQYHRSFKSYLQNNQRESEMFYLFQTECQWKNLTYIPLAPLKCNMCYKEDNSFKTSPVHRFVEPKDRFEEFENQVKSILLAENYQIVEADKCFNEYHQELSLTKSQVADIPQNKYQFIKGEHIVTITYDRVASKYYCQVDNQKSKKYYPPPQKENYKDQKEDKRLPTRYGLYDNQVVYHPILYKYLLHGGDQITEKQIFLDEAKENDIKALLTCFDKITDYTVADIQSMKPKGLSYVFVPVDTIIQNMEQVQYKKFEENFKNLLENIKKEISCFKTEFRMHIYQKKKEIVPQPFNQFNIKYSQNLKDYKPYLHPERFEQVCISQQQVWCPKCVFHLNLQWISSGILPLLLVQSILKSSATQAGFTLIQIPRSIEFYFSQSLPFESIYYIKCQCKEVMKEVKKQIKYVPYECFYDCSTADKIYIHKKGLFFLKMDEEKLQIVWKENVLLNEIQQNSETIYGIYIKFKKCVQEERGRAQTEIDFQGVLENFKKQEDNEQSKINESSAIIEEEEDSNFSLDQLQKDTERVSRINTENQDLVDENDPIFHRILEKVDIQQLSEKNCYICNQQFGVLKKGKSCKFCGQSVCKEHCRKKRQDPKNEKEFHQICDICDQKYIKFEIQRNFVKKRDNLMKEYGRYYQKIQEMTNQIKSLQEVISDQKKQHVQAIGDNKQAQNELIFKISKLGSEIASSKEEILKIEKQREQAKQQCLEIERQIENDEETIIKNNKKRYQIELDTQELENEIKQVQEEITKIQLQKQDQKSKQSFSQMGY